MELKRLFEVVRDAHLLSEHGEVRWLVQFDFALTAEQQLAFRELIDSWAYLGRFSVMPDYHVFDVALRTLNDLERRREVFRSGSMKYYGGVRFGSKVAEWEIDLGSLHEDWLDVLFNCLEGYHMQVTTLKRVELSSEISEGTCT